MKMYNSPVDVKTFSLCRKETLFQAKSQQYKRKLRSSFLANKILSEKLWDFVRRFFAEGFCPGTIWCLFTKLPSFLQLGPIFSKYLRFLYTAR